MALYVISCALALSVALGQLAIVAAECTCDLQVFIEEDNVVVHEHLKVDERSLSPSYSPGRFHSSKTDSEGYIRGITYRMGPEPLNAVVENTETEAGCESISYMATYKFIKPLRYYGQSYQLGMPSMRSVEKSGKFTGILPNGPEKAEAIDERYTIRVRAANCQSSTGRFPNPHPATASPDLPVRDGGEISEPQNKEEAGTTTLATISDAKVEEEEESNAPVRAFEKSVSVSAIDVSSFTKNKGESGDHAAVTSGQEKWQSVKSHSSQNLQAKRSKSMQPARVAKARVEAQKTSAPEEPTKAETIPETTSDQVPLTKIEEIVFVDGEPTMEEEDKHENVESSDLTDSETRVSFSETREELTENVTGIDAADVASSQRSNNIQKHAEADEEEHRTGEEISAETAIATSTNDAEINFSSNEVGSDSVAQDTAETLTTEEEKHEMNDFIIVMEEENADAIGNEGESTAVMGESMMAAADETQSETAKSPLDEHAATTLKEGVENIGEEEENVTSATTTAPETEDAHATLLDKETESNLDPADSVLVVAQSSSEEDRQEPVENEESPDTSVAASSDSAETSSAVTVVSTDFLSDSGFIPVSSDEEEDIREEDIEEEENNEGDVKEGDKAEVVVEKGAEINTTKRSGDTGVKEGDEAEVVVEKGAELITPTRSGDAGVKEGDEAEVVVEKEAEINTPKRSGDASVERALEPKDLPVAPPNSPRTEIEKPNMESFGLSLVEALKRKSTKETKAEIEEESEDVTAKDKEPKAETTAEESNAQNKFEDQESSEEEEFLIENYRKPKRFNRWFKAQRKRSEEGRAQYIQMHLMGPDVEIGSDDSVNRGSLEVTSSIGISKSEETKNEEAEVAEAREEEEKPTETATPRRRFFRFRRKSKENKPTTSKPEAPQVPAADEVSTSEVTEDDGQLTTSPCDDEFTPDVDGPYNYEMTGDIGCGVGAWFDERARRFERFVTDLLS